MIKIIAVIGLTFVPHEPRPYGGGLAQKDSHPMPTGFPVKTHTFNTPQCHLVGVCKLLTRFNHRLPSTAITGKVMFSKP